MFGPDKVNGLNSNIAPVGLAILCYNNRIGFMGDNLGLSVKFCNDFFPTPTDSGICLTKNIDLNEILLIKEKYNSLFEPEPQQPTKKIDNGTTWGGISLILLPEQNIYSANPVRSPDSEKTKLVIKKLKIQLHQDHEIANIFKPNDYDDAIIPLLLKSNHEYFIKGGFQLKFVSISRVMNHMTCNKFECSHWLKSQHSDWRVNLVKNFF